jgi:phospholipase C
MCVLAGCSSWEVEQVDGALPGPAEWNREVTPPSLAQAEAMRASCGYQAGALPAETQGDVYPSGSEIPIDHILIVMMENRSFDHYFQALPAYGQPDVDVADPNFSNPNPAGEEIPIYHRDDYCFVDTSHGWEASHVQVGDGAMRGFVVTNEGNHELPAGGTLEMLKGDRAMGYYDHTDMPFYYWLANEFSIGDRYFASVLGPTWPNRMYLFAATSYGVAKNTLVDAETVIQDQLQLRQVSWKLYVSTTPTLGFFLNKYTEAAANGYIVPIAEYYEDAKRGTLPQVAFVEPGVGRDAWDGNDEHPPANMQYGEQYAAGVIEALTKSPQWSRSALFLSYDEHGGLYDHVPPPDACPPDEHAIPNQQGQPPPAFDTYGIRVPFMVVSPYAKKHHVSHRVYDHTSILRFIQARFIMPAMTARDANAEAPWDMFDFDTPAFAEPPAITVPTPNADKAAVCAAVFD